MQPAARFRLVSISIAAVFLVMHGVGCATIRHIAPNPLHRPCTEEYTETDDGWRLGMRHIRPSVEDPSKLPVVLCHGLGLNGTFWTITNNHLPEQLAAQGYHVFIPDMRGSGASHRMGIKGIINQRILRQTTLNELGDGDWCVDDEVHHDVPAILDHVERETGHKQVNWVGHSLGGMLMFAYLETSDQAWRIANFVGMGSTVVQAEWPQTKMLKANRAIRGLLRVMSTGRIARPMMFARPPGLDSIDRLYYTESNVDRTTVNRFYGYTLENPGRGALKQLDPYLEFGTFVSADGRVDYYEHLGRVSTPILMIAGDGDIMSDLPSTELSFRGVSSKDKTLKRYGRAQGHIHDYGHCDLVWSRYAPREIFPDVIQWLNVRQPKLPSAQSAPGKIGKH